MNINALNEDNLWFIKNVPVAGAKLINSLGEGCYFFSFFPSISFFFFQFYVSSSESLLLKSKSEITDSNENTHAQHVQILCIKY